MRRLHPLCITLLAALVCAGASGADARAQTLPGIGVPSAPAQLPNGVRQEGAFRTAAIWLDGASLFRIATPLVVSGSAMSVEARAQFIEAALAQLTAMKGSQANSGTIYDPKTLRVDVRTDGPQAILDVTDKQHPAAFPILTVTTDDAKYQHEPVSALAQQWQATLQSALVAGLRKRQPGALAQHLADLWHIGIAFAAVTAILGILLVRLRRRESALSEQVEANERAVDEAQAQGAGDEASGARQRLRFMGLAIRAADPAMNLTVLRGFRGLLVWALVLLWFGGLVWALSLFPQTTPLGDIIFHRASRIAFTWIGASLLVRIVAVVAGQLARVYGASSTTARGEENARRLLRIPTIAHTTVGVTSFVVFFVAVLATLSLLGISTASVLTIGGLVALAVSLAAQNLVRDFLNGFLVLFEDQYTVGDYVAIGDRSGLVEHMSLRVVQLRDTSGNLVTIPHSVATEVVNCSRNWSRVDYRIAIDASADTARAIEVLRQAVADLGSDKAWQGSLLGPLEWVGVDAVSTAGIVLRASIKTAPMRQFEIKRELNLRIVEALRAAGIELGTKDAYGV